MQNSTRCRTGEPSWYLFFFFQAEDGIRDLTVTGVQTCALPISVHAYLGGVSYWAKGRSRERQDELIDASEQVVGLYSDGAQIGFARAVDCDAAGFVYLADVYVLDEHRGRGLGVELVREIVQNGPFAGRRWG